VEGNGGGEGIEGIGEGGRKKVSRMGEDAERN